MFYAHIYLQLIYQLRLTEKPDRKIKVGITRAYQFTWKDIAMGYFSWGIKPPIIPKNPEILTFLAPIFHKRNFSRYLSDH